MPFFRFSGEFRTGINHGIDFAAKRFDRRAQRLEHVCKRGGPDHHEVDIAAGPLFPPCDRTIDERQLDCAPEFGDTGTQQFGCSGGFRQQTFELREDGVCDVCLVTHGGFPRLAQEQPQIDQHLEFPMRGPGARFRLPRDLAEMKPLVRVREKQGEQRRPAAAEERFHQGDGCSCSHNENKCTQIESTVQASHPPEPRRAPAREPGLEIAGIAGLGE